MQHARKRSITEITKVERVRPESAQEVHHQTEPQSPALPTIPPSLKVTLDNQVKKLRGAKGGNERKFYVPVARILNELTLLWYGSQQNQPPIVIMHLANPNNPLPGDTYDTQCRPDLISRRATIEELKEYLEQLGSPPATRRIPDIDDFRPSHGEVVSTVELKQ